jgi:hypothetical protein
LNSNIIAFFFNYLRNGRKSSVLNWMCISKMSFALKTFHLCH